MRSWRSSVTKGRSAIKQLHAPVDTCLLLRILFFAVSVPLIMRLKLTRVQSLLESRKPASPPDMMEVEKIIAYVKCALDIGLPFVRQGCLVRGVTSYYFLRRAGLDVSLRFGVGVIDGAYAAHCWLVKDKEPFMEVRDPRRFFTEIYSLGRLASAPAGRHAADGGLASKS